jgi:hypothetical protein
MSDQDGSFDADAALEGLIEMARESMLAAHSERGRRFWWARMTRLIEERSPKQIARMEAERGLG